MKHCKKIALNALQLLLKLRKTKPHAKSKPRIERIKNSVMSPHILAYNAENGCEISKALLLSKQPKNL